MQVCELYDDCSLGIAHNKHVISPQMNERCISMAGLAVLLSGSWRIAAALPVRSLPFPTGVHTLRCLWFRRQLWVLEQAARMFILPFCACSANSSFPFLAKP